MKTEKEIINEQKKYIQEMEQQNTALQQHYEQYVDTVHRMMKEFEP